MNETHGAASSHDRIPLRSSVMGGDHSPAAVTSHAHTTVAHASGVWFWNIILLLSAWLHTRHFTTHAAIGLMLNILRRIFIALGALNPNADVPVTLRTAFKRLNLDDNFAIIPVCPNCLWTHHGTVLVDTLCAQCNTKLFKEDVFPATFPPGPSASQSPSSPKPKLQAPFILPSQLIATLINSTPTMEADLEKWRQRQSIAGQMHSIQDGKIWKTLRASDGELFFDNSPDRRNASELRIGVTCGFDGYVYLHTFSNII